MRFRPTRLLALTVLAALLTPAVATAQSVLNFPRVISSDQVTTELVVVNPSAVTVTYAAFEANGSLVVGVENPTTRTILAGGQEALSYVELFGSADFNGWVRVTSATRGLTGFGLNRNGAGTDLDGGLAAVSGVRFVLPLAAEDGSTKTEVTVVNVGDEAANVGLVLYGFEGESLEVTDVVLEPKAILRQTLEGLFPNAALEGASHVQVGADRPVAAQELVADFKISGSDLGRESGVILGQAPSGAERQVLNQFVTGGGWVSVVGLVNTAETLQTVTLTARGNDGSVLAFAENPKTVTLPANGGWRGTVAELFSVAGTEELESGWIEVESLVGRIASYVGQGYTNTPSFGVVPGVEETEGAQLNVYQKLAEGDGFFTALALVNPTEGDATAEFYILQPDGTTLGMATLEVAPLSRISAFYRDLLPAALVYPARSNVTKIAFQRPIENEESTDH